VSGSWKTVRVFISSTFRDMHAERDHLVKVVFPALREELEKYRIHLVDIDLRWGVTQEQAENDEALDVCLDQIDACRPFFIAILGERYGYVSAGLPDRVVRKHGWIRNHIGKSIVELEIRHGALNDSPRHGRALFLFRDKAFLENVPSDKRDDFEAEDEESAAKLKSLKQAIHDARVQVVSYSCDYGRLKADGDVRLTGLDEFGRQVAEWLGPAVKEELKLQHQPSPLGADPLAEESDFHERFMESRLRVYVGREQVNDALTAFVESDESAACLVTGPSGSGKSAALARFVTEYRRRRQETLLVSHFIGAGPASTNPRQVLLRFCVSLKNALGFAEEIPQAFDELATLFRSFLTRIPAERHTVFILDALNQLDTTDNAHSLYWLPGTLPQHVKMIVSCIDDGDKSDPILRAFANRRYHFVPIPALADDERRQIILAVPSLSAKTLDHLQVELLLSNPATSNPLFLLVALEELRGFGTFKQLDRRIVEFPHPVEEEPRRHDWLIRAKRAADNLLNQERRRTQLARLEQIESTLAALVPVDDTLTAVFRQVIDRLEVDFGPQVPRTVLSLLASAKEGLSERELHELLARLLPKQDGKRRDEGMQVFLRQVRSYLMHKGLLLDFYHRSFWKAGRARYLKTAADCHDAHRELADYFSAEPYHLPKGAPTISPNYRKVIELPWQRLEMVRKASEDNLASALPIACDRLEKLFEDLFFLETKIEAGLVFELATEFTQCVSSLSDARPRRRILKLLDEALRRDIHFIARHVKNYPQALFQCLWNSGWWYDCPEAVAHYDLSKRKSKGLLPWDLPAQERLMTLLERWREEKEKAMPAFTWLRSLRPPMAHLGTAQSAVIRGHEGWVSSVAVGSDGRCIVSGALDATVRVWDAATGQELLCLRGHEDWVKSVAISADGRRIISGSDDKTVRVWDATTGQELLCLRGHLSDVDGVVVSSDGRRVASGSDDMTVRVWDSMNGYELLCLRGHEKWVTTVALSGDGRRIVSGSDDASIRVWDAATGQELLCLRGHESGVRSVALSGDGRRIVSGSYDDTIRVWDAATGQELLCLRGHDAMSSVALSGDGQCIVSGSPDKTVRVWNAANGHELLCLRGHESQVTSVAWLPGDRRITSGSNDKSVRVWDATNGREVLRLRGHESHVSKVAVSGDGRYVISGSHDDTVRIWNATNGRELRCLQGHEGWVSGVAVGSDGQSIISGSLDNTVRVWDAAAGQELTCLRGHESPVNSVALSGDGRRIISGSQDNSVRVWDAVSGRQLLCLRGHDDMVTSVAVSGDGRRIVSGAADKTVRVWDAVSGQGLFCLREHEDEIMSVAVSGDGRCIVSGAWNETVVWDGTNGKCLQIYEGRTDVFAIAMGARMFPFIAVTRTLETVFDDAGSQCSVAWLSESLRSIAPYPSGGAWAGAVGDHVCAIALEGNASPTK